MKLNPIERLLCAFGHPIYEVKFLEEKNRELRQKIMELEKYESIPAIIIKEEFKRRYKNLPSALTTLYRGESLTREEYKKINNHFLKTCVWKGGEK